MLITFGSDKHKYLTPINYFVHPMAKKTLVGVVCGGSEDGTALQASIKDGGSEDTKDSSVLQDYNGGSEAAPPY